MKSIKKRFRQGTLSDFIQITKMSKATTDVSATSTAANQEASLDSGANLTDIQSTSLERTLSDFTQVTETSKTVTEVSPASAAPTATSTKVDRDPSCSNSESGTSSTNLQSTLQALKSNELKIEKVGASIPPPEKIGEKNSFPVKSSVESEPGTSKVCASEMSKTSLSEDLLSESDSLDDDFCSENFSSDNLKRYTQFPPSLPPLATSENHTVLFNYKTLPNRAPLPYPKSYRDKWDSFHVRLPCSPQSLYPVKNALTGEEELQSRWELIQSALSNPIRCSSDLEEAIFTYNSQHSNQWKFKVLHRLLNEHFQPSETKEFFEKLLPKIIDLCLQTPNICTQPIPMLKSGKSHKITVSQKQIACLLANAFFCTFPRRNTRNRTSEYASYPGINFYTLYDPNGRPNKVEKLKCLINYFKCVTKEEPVGVVTFHRQCVNDFPSWNESNTTFKNLCAQSEGLIEVDGMGMLQIDFANKFVGGGVLGSGCVQEEIRFIICPELIVSRLFTERLAKNEALIVTGCEQFNQHTGYAETFRWDGNFEDCIPRDSWGRKLTRVVAIDALHFACGTEQFNPEQVQREMEKAYSGYLETSDTDFLPAVATGNWGCGAFRGDPRLKALIQLMSAAETGRDLLYLTFGDKQLERDLCKMFCIIKNRDLKVGQLVKMIEDYHRQVVSTKGSESLYSFLFRRCMDSDSETEIDSPL